MKIENISMQIKNEKSCARSMSDEDLVRAVRPGLTAVGPFMFVIFSPGIPSNNGEFQHVTWLQTPGILAWEWLCNLWHVFWLYNLIPVRSVLYNLKSPFHGVWGGLARCVKTSCTVSSLRYATPKVTKYQRFNFIIQIHQFTIKIDKINISLLFECVKIV